MTILDTILSRKKPEVAGRKNSMPIKVLEKSRYFNRAPISLKKALESNASIGIIAEFKRKSPSKPNIQLNANIENIVKGYEKGGASAISILTDSEFFGGTIKDFSEARELVTLPLLRKDFITDEYQLVESKSIGADLVLLIAAALEPVRLKQLASVAKNIGLEVILEVHNREELEKSLNEAVDFVGVNNRNLKTFEVNLDTSFELAKLIPDAVLKISESGLSNPGDIQRLIKAGYRGFLVGETLMKSMDPGNAVMELIKSVGTFDDHPECFIRIAEIQDLNSIEQLAHKIWKQYYPGIISDSQIEYMLRNMYSIEVLRKNFAGPGNEFAVALEKNQVIGYVHTETKNGADYFLHKLYVDPHYHGKKLGKKMFDFVFSAKKDLRSVRLQVNRNNTRAIRFYKKINFEIEYEKDFDIGNGYYMNDFVMLKKYGGCH